MRKTSLLIIATVICLFISLPASGRRLHLNRLTVPEPDADTLSWYTGVMRPYELAIDRPDWDSLISHPAEPPAILPTGFYAEPVFDPVRFIKGISGKICHFIKNFVCCFFWYSIADTARNTFFRIPIYKILTFFCHHFCFFL